MSIEQASTTLATCPYCGHTIGASERDRILRAEGERIASRVADRLDTEKAKINAEMAAKLAALESAKREAEDRTTRLEQEMERKVEERVAGERVTLEADSARRINAEIE